MRPELRQDIIIMKTEYSWNEAITSPDIRIVKLIKIFSIFSIKVLTLTDRQGLKWFYQEQEVPR